MADTTASISAQHGRCRAPTNYRPAWWLPGPHAQTLWAALANTPPLPPLRRERLELPDGDFVDLDHVGPEDAPLVLILHGLEGGRDSPYARALLGAVEARHWHGVLLNLRGCSGEPNRLPRAYHSGDTGDLAHVAAHLQRCWPGQPLAAVGFSLGGNVLLKYLGETGPAARPLCAVAVSVPFDLGRAADRLSQGFSRIYQRHLISRLRAKVRRKSRRMAYPIAIDDLDEWRDFRTFDDRVTAPLNGFPDADTYYQRASCRQFLNGITRPTLILQALDDPFLPSDAIPHETELGAPVVLELAAHGGHVGFISGWLPGRGRRWLEPRIVDFLANHLAR